MPSKEQTAAEQERIIAMIRREQRECDDIVGRLLCDRIINKIAAESEPQPPKHVRARRHQVARVIAEELLAADDPDATLMLLCLHDIIRRERLNNDRIGEAIVRTQHMAIDGPLKSLLVRVGNRLIGMLGSDGNSEFRRDET